MLCDMCKQTIHNNNPAILIGPSCNTVYSVKKFNLCNICYKDIYNKIQF